MDLKEICYRSPEAFGAYIRRQRKNLGYSMRDMALKLKISFPYLCDIERGRRDAPLSNSDLMKRMIKYLKVTDVEEFTILAIASKGWDLSYLSH